MLQAFQLEVHTYVYTHDERNCVPYLIFHVVILFLLFAAVLVQDVSC